MNAALSHPEYVIHCTETPCTVVLGRDVVFQSENETLCREFVRVFSCLQTGFPALAEDVRLWAEKEQHLRLSPACLISLFDVVTGAPKMPIAPMNPLPLVASLYPQEYDVACYTAQRIRDCFEIVLSEEQVNAFVAVLIRYQLDAVESGPRLGSITELLLDMCAIIRSDLTIPMDPKESNTRRFLVHLRFLATRVLEDAAAQHEVDPAWYEEFTQQYPEAYRCTLKIADLLAEKYQHPIGVDERMYLLIHLAQLLRVLRGQDKD